MGNMHGANFSLKIIIVVPLVLTGILYFCSKNADARVTQPINYQSVVTDATDATHGFLSAPDKNLDDLDSLLNDSIAISNLAVSSLDGIWQGVGNGSEGFTVFYLTLLDGEVSGAQEEVGESPEEISGTVIINNNQVQIELQEGVPADANWSFVGTLDSVENPSLMTGQMTGGPHGIEDFELNLSPRTIENLEWSQINSSASWSARYSHTSVVFNNKIWLLGGKDSHGEKDDVWYSADGIEWIEAETSAESWPPRASHASVVYDDKIWVMAGSQGSTLYNDVWMSPDGINWSRVSDSTPWSARHSPGLVVHEGLMWIMGGSAAEGDKQDVWTSSDGMNWSDVNTTASWEARKNHAVLSYDGRIWVIGGAHKISTNFSIAFSDVWSSINGQEWILMKDTYTYQLTEAFAFKGSSAPVAVQDSGEMWLLTQEGQWDPVAWHSSNGIIWDEASVPSWSGRGAHSSVVFNDKIWVLGGYSGAFTLYNDVWCTSGDSTGPTLTPTLTSTPTSTETPTESPTRTDTVTVTPMNTDTPTPSNKPTLSPTPRSTASNTPTATNTPSPTATPTGSTAQHHAADTNGDWTISIGEAATELNCWLDGQCPIGEAAKALSLWLGGGCYHFTEAEGYENIACPTPAQISAKSQIQVLQSNSATRSLPSSYEPAVLFNVTITLNLSDPPPGVLLIEEQVPSGWIVSDISNNGTFSSGSIKWSFVDGLGTFPPPAAVSYSIIPPSESLGQAAFQGVIASPDESPIGGDSTIDVETSEISASRSLPDCYTPEASSVVTITLNLPDPPPDAVLLEDAYPAGWIASNISNSGSDSGGKVRWAFVDGLSNFPPPESVSYEIQPPEGASGEALFSGTLATPEESAVIGDLSIPNVCISPPTPTQPPMVSNARSDVNEDGYVDHEDLIQLQEDWHKWRLTPTPVR